MLVVEESNTCVLDGLVVTRRGYSEGFRWVRSGVYRGTDGTFPRAFAWPSGPGHQT